MWRDEDQVTNLSQLKTTPKKKKTWVTTKVNGWRSRGSDLTYSVLVVVTQQRSHDLGNRQNGRTEVESLRGVQTMYILFVYRFGSRKSTWITLLVPLHVDEIEGSSPSGTKWSELSRNLSCSKGNSLVRTSKLLMFLDRLLMLIPLEIRTLIDLF